MATWPPEPRRLKPGETIPTIKDLCADESRLYKLKPLAEDSSTRIAYSLAVHVGHEEYSEMIEWDELLATPLYIEEGGRLLTICYGLCSPKQTTSVVLRGDKMYLYHFHNTDDFCYLLNMWTKDNQMCEALLRRLDDSQQLKTLILLANLRRDKWANTNISFARQCYKSWDNTRTKLLQRLKEVT